MGPEPLAAASARRSAGFSARASTPRRRRPPRRRRRMCRRRSARQAAAACGRRPWTGLWRRRLRPAARLAPASLSASASACWPPAPPPQPAPQSLTDSRWPPDGFLCCLRGPEVTTPLPPGARPISAAEGAGRLLLLGETWSCPGPGGRLWAGKGWRVRQVGAGGRFPAPGARGHPRKSRRRLWAAAGVPAPGWHVQC